MNEHEQMMRLIDAVVAIKWTLICVAVSLWGLTVYLFLKEFPSVWSGKRAKSELDKLPPEGSPEGHYQ